MLLRSGIVTFSLLMLALTLPVRAQEWSEDQVIQRFLQQSPQTRELRARVAMAQAEARGRTLYPNPSFTYSREGAGFNEFFEVGQTLPISGRLGYLRQAGTAAASEDTNRSADQVLTTAKDLSRQAAEMRHSVDRFLANVAA